jgi:hypothetical protein
MLLQIRNLYPNWNKSDEVNYWLARIYLEAGDTFQGLRMLSQVYNPSFLADSRAIRKDAYAKISDPETLDMILEEYPGDTLAAIRLCAVVGAQPIPQRDNELFQRVLRDYDLEENRFTDQLFPESPRKQEYTVAALFPLMVQTLEPTPTRKRNQSALDLYEGMSLAADTLRSLGMPLRLLAYDTERDPHTVKKLLESGDLLSADLIAGPLFQDEIKIVQEYSMAHKINMMSPVSNNPDYLGENPYALLLQPGLDVLGERSAELMNRSLTRKTCMVFYGDSRRDSLLAASFIRKAASDSLVILLSKKTRKEDLPSILTLLATPTEFDKFGNPSQFKLKKDSIGGVFVASSDPLIYPGIIGSVESRSDSTLIVGSEDWLDLPSADFSTYERMRIMLAAPGFVPPDNPRYVAFMRSYLTRYGKLPSVYARQGFEFMMFAGQALHRYGKYFQQGLQAEEFTTGWFNGQYSYKGARDNQAFPFVRFRSGVLSRVDE